jgi:AraC family transcriptional regulator, transcriptional activator FtrA
MIDAVRDKPANPPKARRAGFRHPQTRRDRDVAVIVSDGVNVFELGVACEVFGECTANDMAELAIPWYRLFVCGSGADPVTADAGFTIQPDHGLEKIQEVGTIVVLPTQDLERVPTEVIDGLRQAHAGGCRIVSFCTGAFVLAAAGLLDGRRATTHWTECGELVSRFPEVSVDPGVLYVDGGDILTSAGSAASIDLCLHVVRHDYGSEIATRLARQLVVPPQRDGGQAQFIETPISNAEEPDFLAATVAWVQEHLDDPLTVGDLAARSAMSPRTFARRFVASTGSTPHQWLQNQRIQLAQRLLETTDLPIEAVAERCGFRTAGNLRKHFSRVVLTSPQAYRHAFQDRLSA